MRGCDAREHRIALPILFVGTKATWRTVNRLRGFQPIEGGLFRVGAVYDMFRQVLRGIEAIAHNME